MNTGNLLGLEQREEEKREIEGNFLDTDCRTKNINSSPVSVSCNFLFNVIFVSKILQLLKNFGVLYLTYTIELRI